MGLIVKRGWKPPRKGLKLGPVGKLMAVAVGLFAIRKFTPEIRRYIRMELM